MDPVLITTAAEALKLGITLFTQYTSGDTSVEAQLQQWVSATKAYEAGSEAFNTARGPGEPASGAAPPPV